MIGLGPKTVNQPLYTQETLTNRRDSRTVVVPGDVSRKPCRGACPARCFHIIRGSVTETSITKEPFRFIAKSRVVDELFARIKAGYHSRSIACERPHLIVVTPNDLAEFVPFVERLHCALEIREPLRHVDGANAIDHLIDPSPDAILLLRAELLDACSQNAFVLRFKSCGRVPSFMLLAASVDPDQLRGGPKPAWGAPFLDLFKSEKRIVHWPRMKDRSEDWGELFRVSLIAKGRELNYPVGMIGDVPNMYATIATKHPPPHVAAILRHADRCIRILRDMEDNVLSCRILGNALFCAPEHKPERRQPIKVSHRTPDSDKPEAP